jgi:hypothetical protein
MQHFILEGVFKFHEGEYENVQNLRDLR